ncbi:hypothetical protein [Streptomyces sp. NPDC001139]
MSDTYLRAFEDDAARPVTPLEYLTYNCRQAVLLEEGSLDRVGDFLQGQDVSRTQDRHQPLSSRHFVSGYSA